MSLAHLHTPKIIPIYTQGRSNEFNVSVMKHRMHEREFRMWQARVRGSGYMLSREIFEKSVHLGAFWHIFIQLNSFSESFFFYRQRQFRNEWVK